MNPTEAWRVKGIVSIGQARADVRRLDISTAMRLFAALHRFAQTWVGDVENPQTCVCGSGTTVQKPTAKELLGYFGASWVIPPWVLAASLAAFIFLVSSAFWTQPSAVSTSFL
jgi:disulfide bond formation protein DsbB